MGGGDFGGGKNNRFDGGGNKGRGKGGNKGGGGKFNRYDNNGNNNNWNNNNNNWNNNGGGGRGKGRGFKGYSSRGKGGGNKGGGKFGGGGNFNNNKNGGKNFNSNNFNDGNNKGGGKGKNYNNDNFDMQQGSGNPFESGNMGNQRQTGGGGTSSTGPILGKNSQLKKIYTVNAGDPRNRNQKNSAHANSVEAMSLFGPNAEKLATGGLDQKVMIWEGKSGGPQGGILEKANEISLQHGVKCLEFIPNDDILFVGLTNGEIKVYKNNPFKEFTLSGHTKAATSIKMAPTPSGEPVILTSSKDGHIRMWVWQTHTESFNCTHVLQPEVGPIASILLLNNCLWVGGQRGISCMDLESLQVAGVIETPPVCGPLIHYEGFVISSFEDGSLAIYDEQGNEEFLLEAHGDHTTNTAFECMQHPSGTLILLCGQQDGFVTAYDLPALNARGSFITQKGSTVKFIKALNSNNMFVTGGEMGEITLWMWDPNYCG